MHFTAQHSTALHSTARQTAATSQSAKKKNHKCTEREHSKGAKLSKVITLE